jgi:hypothetical protein
MNAINDILYVVIWLKPSRDNKGKPAGLQALLCRGIQGNVPERNPMDCGT